MSNLVVMVYCNTPDLIAIACEEVNVNNYEVLWVWDKHLPFILCIYAPFSFILGKTGDTLHCAKFSRSMVCFLSTIRVYDMNKIFNEEALSMFN